MKTSTKAMLHTAHRMKIFGGKDRRVMAGAIRYGRKMGRGHAWRKHYLTFTG